MAQGGTCRHGILRLRQCPRLSCVLDQIRAGAFGNPLVVVERSTSNLAFVVVTKPRCRAVTRAFPFAWQALEHAALLADELNGRVIDHSWMPAS